MNTENELRVGDKVRARHKDNLAGIIVGTEDHPYWRSETVFCVRWFHGATGGGWRASDLVRVKDRGE